MKQIQNQSLVLVLILLLMLGGCKKFLVIETSTEGSNPNTVADYEAMLNNPDICNPNYLFVDLFSDDVRLVEETSILWRAYTWNKTVFGEADEDNSYNDCYKWIMHMNMIIERIANAPNGSAERIAIAIAQAKINRASYYLQLVNIYGPAFNKATAATDLGVPLVLTAFAQQNSPRATVQQVYEQVLADLSDALNTAELPVFGADILHPGKAAALALQARAQLYMGNYDSALQSASGALAIRNTLLNYNSLTDKAKKPWSLLDQVKNPEVLLARVGSVRPALYTNTGNALYCDDKLLKIFGSGDLRLLYGMTEDSNNETIYYIPNWSPNTYHFNYGPNVPEMMLIKAECLARNNEAKGALALLDELRKNRIAVQEFAPLDKDANATEVLRLTLEERRRELFMHGGLRVFDIKRLNLPVQRIDANGEVIVSLPANSPKLIMPFSPKTIALNPLIIQNNR